MFLIAFALIAILAVSSFYYLVTEVVAYVGAILILAGGAVAISQRWHAISHWGHVGVLAGAAAFFLVVGVLGGRLKA